MEKQNRRYELTVIVLLFFVWGLVFMDRLAISFLIPTITPELGLTNLDIGLIGTVTTGCYAASSIFFGIISDKFGYKKRMLVPFLFLVAIFSGLGVTATSFHQLLAIRALVGFAEGPMMPLIFSLVAGASEKNLGRNSGIVNAAVGILATSFGPVFITQLVLHFSWQYTFLVSSIPTFAIAILVIVFIREMKVETNVGEAQEPVEKLKFTDLFKIKNFILCLIMNILLLCSYWTMMLFASTYLVSFANLSVQNMGYVTAVMGILLVVYSVGLPKLSDNIGRKRVVNVAVFLIIFSPLSMFLFPGSTLSVVLYVIFGGAIGVMSFFAMVIMPMDSVPITLRASASAIIQGAGEILGGALWPSVVGVVADNRGLPFAMLLTSLLLVVSFVVSLFLDDTRKKKIEAKQVVAQ